MKHLVFILGAYYPNYSAVGACARRVIECLGKDFRITVLSVHGAVDHRAREVHDGVEIARVKTPERARRLQLEADSSALARYRLKLDRLWWAVRKLVAPETVDRSLVLEYVRALGTLENKVDIIIPLVFPFESVLAALAFKDDNPQVAVFPYLFDDFVESRSLHLLAINRIIKKRRHLELERAMLDDADAVLAMHPLREHFVSHFDRPRLRKITYLEHPLLSPPTSTTDLQPDTAIAVVYAGSFIRKVREPDYLLAMLQIMKASSPLRADFYVMGNSAHKIKTATVPGRLEIRNHGQVSKEESAAAIARSNILLNLGEIRGKQISSKVFEYIATGKPIIHLEYASNDAVTALLAKYPLALCLPQEPKKLAENARLCAEFIDRHKRSQISFPEVAALYPEALPQATADTFRQLAAGVAA